MTHKTKVPKPVKAWTYLLSTGEIAPWTSISKEVGHEPDIAVMVVPVSTYRQLVRQAKAWRALNAGKTATAYMKKGKR